VKKFIAGTLVFCFLFSIGILLARHKPLWTDELFGQQATVQRTSWPDIILGQTPEINKFPLFFMLQKGFLQLFHFQLGFVWDGSSLVVDPQAQVVLRVLPDILMSLAMTAIVLFFGFRSGYVGAIVAALICWSMPMVWLYWVEARPYALWFMLTVIQALLFISTASQKEINAPKVPFLLVNLGLCLTAPLGVIQTIVGQGLLWWAGARRGKFHIISGLGPLFLGAYYMMAQEKIGMYLFVPWQQIFLRNFSFEEMVFLGMFIILLLLSWRVEALHKYFLFGRIFLPFCLAFIAIAVAGLFYVVWKSNPQSPPVAERHFIFLTPIGIIMTVAIFTDWWLAAASRWWLRLGLVIIFGAGLLEQILSAFMTVYFSVYY
jgi:hypothetical protein